MARPKRPKQSVVIGQLVRIDEAYPRELAVPHYPVVSLLWTGALARTALTLVRRGAGGGGPRRWKDVRKGPEYLVTPVRVRDGRGRFVELEIHGYLAANALHTGDRVRIRYRRQSDKDLAPRAYHIANVTTGQILLPRAPTLWSHLGPDVVLQALLGLFLLLVVAACLWAVFA